MPTMDRLAKNGTFWIGKNHNVPVNAFDMGASTKSWPLGLGYDPFYGFLGGETNQWIRIHRGQPLRRAAGAARGRVSLLQGHRREGDQLHSRFQAVAAGEALVRSRSPAAA
jgi:arylsulfatase A-like enzyme